MTTHYRTNTMVFQMHATFKAAMDEAKRAAPSERMAYPVSDACDALGISRTSLYQLIKIGELKVIKLAGRTLVPRSELERLTHVDR
jgi:excisionase family DNA binding protein